MKCHDISTINNFSFLGSGPLLPRFWLLSEGLFFFGRLQPACNFDGGERRESWRELASEGFADADSKSRKKEINGRELQEDFGNWIMKIK